MELFRTKAFRSNHSELRHCLTGFDLVLLGVGLIIGAGIFVLTGIAAATKSGPAIVLSYALAGLASSFAALCYAELAASIGGAGSAYTYAYTALGELIAWMIGWDLILEYGLGACTVSIGWSGYVNDALYAIGIHIPQVLLKSPFEGGFFNFPAMLIVLFLTCILSLGVKQSANFNAAIVFIKLTAIAIFIWVAWQDVNPKNWTPFMPFGWNGVVSGAALVFFAYIGFDAVSTAAEEARDPQKDLPIGILGSLAICTIIYIVVSLLLTGITSYTTLNVKSPVAETILNLGHRFTAGIVAAGAIAGLTSVILIFMYGLSRVFYAMSRDGLLPPLFSHVNAKTQTPSLIVFCSGLIIALLAGLLPIHAVAEMVNIGTLAAFVVVCFGVLFLRYTKPDMPRPFKTPFSPLFPILGILFCGYLMAHLPFVTWMRFFIWMAIGLIIYFSYSRYHSLLSLSAPKAITEES